MLDSTLQVTVTATPLRDNATVFAWRSEARKACEDISSRDTSEGWGIHVLTNGLMIVQGSRKPTLYARLAIV